jgi:hypothetical protein
MHAFDLQKPRVSHSQTTKEKKEHRCTRYGSVRQHAVFDAEKQSTRNQNLTPTHPLQTEHNHIEMKIRKYRQIYTRKRLHRHLFPVPKSGWLTTACQAQRNCVV